MVIAAHFDKSPEEAGKARDPRRMLRLEARGLTASGDAARVLIHNISASGLLLESEAALEANERIDVDLPQAGKIAARVIWASGSYYGCQFETAISTAVLSATQLRSEASGSAAAEPRSSVGGGFGAKLLRLRKDRGLTQAALAEQLGVSKPTVWAWEQGKARPVESRMDLLADALDVPVSELLIGSDSAFPSDLIARAKGQIASALGISPDKIRIVIDL
ncbi:MAG: helix-turn-helix domain-containing protein [Novosphingobium sp.]